MNKRCSVESWGNIIKKSCIYDFDNEKIEEITVFTKDMKESEIFLTEKIYFIYKNGKLLNVYYIGNNTNTKIVDNNYYKIIEKISNYRRDNI